MDFYVGVAENRPELLVGLCGLTNAHPVMLISGVAGVADILTLPEIDNAKKISNRM